MSLFGAMALTPLLVLGCGGPGSETGAGGTTTTGTTSTSCSPGSVQGPTGACMPVGIQGCADMFLEDDNLCHPTIEKCPAGTIPKFDEGCVPVGVPGCSPDLAEDGMCAASLTKCPEGTFPIPQEGCRPIDGPDGCGDGTWGDLVEAMGDVHVDQGAPAGGSGTRAAPYQSIAEALLAVSAGGRVVIAAGTYDEPIVLQDSIEVVGRCPSMVKITGSQDVSGIVAAVALVQADGAAVRSITVEGHPVLSRNSKGATIDGLVVQKSVGAGIWALGGQTTVTHTWIDGTGSGPETGDLADGVQVGSHADLTIAHSAVTSSQRISLALSGTGTAVHVEDSLFEQPLAGAGDRVGIMADSKATMDIVNSVVTAARQVGIGVFGPGTAVSITGCEVRDTRAMAERGIGIAAVDGSVVNVLGSVISRSNYVGFQAAYGALATLDSVLVTGTGNDPNNTDPSGTAIDVQLGATLNVLRSAVSDSAGSGINVYDPGTVFRLEASAVERSNLMQPDPTVAENAIVWSGAALTASGSFFSKSGRLGLLVADPGTTATLDHCLFEKTVPDIQGKWGVAMAVVTGGRSESTASAFVANAFSAVQVQDAGSTWISTGDYLAGEVESARGALILSGASASLSGSVLRDQHGFGIFVYEANASLSGCSIDSVRPLDVSLADQTYEGVADGLIAQAQSKVDVSDLAVDDCARAALLFDDSTGSLAGTSTAGGRFGLVLQGAVQPAVSEDNAFRGTEKDIVTGGDLSVPSAPLPVPGQ